MIADVLIEGKATGPATRAVILPFPTLLGPAASQVPGPDGWGMDDLPEETASGVFRAAWRDVANQMLAEPPMYE